MTTISHKRLLELVTYDPKTGRFLCRTTRGTLKIGDICGSMNKGGYILISIERWRIYAHRLAWFYMTGKWPKAVDHEDRCRSNNKWQNLRDGGQKGNSGNVALLSNNTSGIRGVSFDKQTGKWRAKIKIDGKTCHIGRYFEKADAEKAYRYAAVSHFGEFLGVEHT